MSIEKKGMKPNARTSLSVFKNGVALVEKVYNLSSAGNGELLSREESTQLWCFRLPVPPHTIYGSLDTSVNDGCEIHSVCAQQAEASESRACQSIGELLSANKEAPLRLVLREPMTVGGEAVTTVAVQRIVTLQPSFLIGQLATGGDTVVLQLSDVRAVQAGGEAALRSSITTTSRKNYLVLRTRTAPTAVVVRYLTTRITWLPSYTFNLQLRAASAAASSSEAVGVLPPPKRLGAVTMRALLMNDADGDADDDNLVADVSCIAGQPNIRYASIADPVASSADVPSFMQQLSYAASPSSSAAVRYNRAPQMQQVMMNAASFSDTPDVVQATDAGSDFFRYRFHDVELPLGSRTALPVLTDAPIVYDDVYVVNIPAANPGAAARDPSSPGEQHDVVHYVRFTNTTAVPWTTAPASIFVNDEFSSQDQLAFTPVGTEARVRLTASVSVSCCCAEDIDPAHKAERVVINGSHYSKYRVAGVVKLRNMSLEPVRIEISKEIKGEYIAAAFSTPPTKLTQPPIQHSFNPPQTATFETLVAGQQTVQISFAYFFVTS